MEKLTFQKLNLLCEKNVVKKYVDLCLQIIRNEDCIFVSGIIMPHDHIASLYRLRFDIAKENATMSDSDMNDYEDCVDKLNKSTSDFLGITSLHSDINSFLIFYEPDTEAILGILKSENSFDLSNLEKNETEKINRGFSSSAEKYSKGTYIRDWK